MQELAGPLADLIGKGEGPASSEQQSQWYCTATRLIPAHLRGALSVRTPATTRLVRKDLWKKYGKPMHFLTLEFQDDAVETKYQRSVMRRNFLWVERLCFLRALLSLAIAVSNYFVHRPSTRYETLFYCVFSVFQCVLYLLQAMQMVCDRSFLFRNFQHVLFFWAFLQALLIIVYTTLIAPDLYKVKYPYACDPRHQPPLSPSEASDVSGLMSQASSAVDDLISTYSLLLLVIFRLRFIYFLYANLLVVLGYTMMGLGTIWIYGFDSPCAPNRLQWRFVWLISAGLSVTCYLLEILQRKDFQQAETVEKESESNGKLLLNILPETIIERLKVDSKAIATSYSGVTVFFADVVSFTTMSKDITPDELVKLLNQMFLAIDKLAEDNHVEKIKTIGDCYMAAAGLPEENRDHAKTMARFGLQMLELMRSGNQGQGFRNPTTGNPIQVRAGMHSGAAVAGVIGTKKFAYDLWGDAVNTASRMESHGEAMKLHCSDASYELIKDDFDCEAREKMKVKGKGEMSTYFVVAEKASALTKSFIRKRGAQDEDDLSRRPSHTGSEDLDGRSEGTMQRALDAARRASRRISSLGYDLPGGGRSTEVQPKAEGMVELQARSEAE